MLLHFKQGHDLIFIDKPRGITTHATDPGKPGMVELFEKQLKKKLYVVHRLDKATSGAMTFATTPERAQQISEEFKNHKVKKKYWFVTDRTSSHDQFVVQSQIQQINKKWQSENYQIEAIDSSQSDNFESEKDKSKNFNAITKFTRIKRSPFFELWQAEPQTGKTHQIRLHAQDLKLPILGDSVYNGTAFPVLCLHALELQIPGELAWQCPAPRFFERLALLKDPTLTKWVSEIDRRQRLFDFLNQPLECIRLIHLPEFRIDLLGPQLWIYWYPSSPPTIQDLDRVDTLSDLLAKPYLLKIMNDRGADPLKKWDISSSHRPFLSPWQAQENQMIFEFRHDVGQSSGLFLDQADRRLEVKETSEGLRVLNLFSYTCGFSVAAALGNAEKVTSVDVSPAFLDWGKTHFLLNKLNPDEHEFFVQDSLLFLQGALKRQRKFDLIICDPPSFGRHKKQVFKLEKDFPELIQLCWDCLATKSNRGQPGRILFSCNFEKWTSQDLVNRVKKCLPQSQVQMNIGRLDFEIPPEESLMKSVWIKRK